VEDGRPGLVGLAEQRSALAGAVSAGRPVPAGRLFGLPELAGDDYWVDIAGASALTGIPPKTITSWLTRGGPKRNPFPVPRRHLYRLHWTRAEITSWQARNRTYTSRQPCQSRGRPALAVRTAHRTPRAECVEPAMTAGIGAEARAWDGNGEAFRELTEPYRQEIGLDWAPDVDRPDHRVARH